MFNPKQVLERLRKNKTMKQDVHQFEASDEPLFPDPPDESIKSRLSKLENIISELSSELKTSKETIVQLKKDNNQLETQLLKLEHQNSQLKQYKKPSKTSIQASKERKEESKAQEQREVYCKEVEEVLEQIRKEPLENLLKRKQQKFRALKQDPKVFQTGNKYLKQLQTILKDYSKAIKKPVLYLQLDPQDFQQQEQ